jgi:hypothetical protein
MLAPLKALASSLSSFPPGSPTGVINPDRDIGKARTIAYSKYVLYLIASFIVLISLSHFLSLGYRYATRKRAHRAQLRTSFSTIRLPTALADSLRALVFRWTVPIGSSFTLSLAELGLAVGYIGVLFSWTLVGSMFLAIYRFRISVTLSLARTLSGIQVEPRYYRDRAGRIAASQFPIMAALGMRNNLISCSYRQFRAELFICI